MLIISIHYRWIKINFHLKFEFLMKEDNRTTLENGDRINISTNGAIYIHKGYFAVGNGDGFGYPSHASKEAKAMIKKNGFTKKTNLYNVWNKAELIINDNKITMLINGKFLIKDFERAKDKRFLKGSGPIGFSKHSDKSYKVKVKGSDKKGVIMTKKMKEMSVSVRAKKKVALVFAMLKMSPRIKSCFYLNRPWRVTERICQFPVSTFTRQKTSRKNSERAKVKFITSEYIEPTRKGFNF